MEVIGIGLEVLGGAIVAMIMWSCLVKIFGLGAAAFLESYEKAGKLFKQSKKEESQGRDLPPAQPHDTRCKELCETREKKLVKKANEPVHKMLIIQIGDDKASNAYIKGKIKDAEELGHRATLIKFSNDTTTDEVYKFLENNISEYSGVILQEPANFSPRSIRRESDILDLIPDYKDIDGFKKTSRHKPATPRGIVDYLEYLGYKDLKGKLVAVVGKGKLVGEPLVPMLMKKGATVISCNSATPCLKVLLLQADIVIAATGVRGLIQDDMISTETLVIDAGISVDENGKLHGDCDPSLYDREGIDITPVPGGVGLLTRLALMKNFLGK